MVFAGVSLDAIRAWPFLDRAFEHDKLLSTDVRFVI